MAKKTSLDKKFTKKYEKKLEAERRRAETAAVRTRAGSETRRAEERLVRGVSAYERFKIFVFKAFGAVVAGLVLGYAIGIAAVS